MDNSNPLLTYVDYMWIFMFQDMCREDKIGFFEAILAQKPSLINDNVKVLDECEEEYIDPINAALQCGSAELLKLLLSKGPVFQEINPLYLAHPASPHEATVEKIKLLIEYGVEIDGETNIVLEIYKTLSTNEYCQGWIDGVEYLLNNTTVIDDELEELDTLVHDNSDDTFIILVKNYRQRMADTILKRAKSARGMGEESE